MMSTQDGLPEAQLRAFYEKTATAYDDDHELEIEHRTAMRFGIPLLRGMSCRRILDVGCGTGRAMRAISAAWPDADVMGIDPSPELLAVAHERHGISSDKLLEGGGERLPFPDNSFDATIAMAVLHHVPDWRPVVAEMLRVSRSVVLISDSNRYAQGGMASRLVKVVLRNTGAMRPVDRYRLGKGGFYTSDGDGVAWPFSVFDTLPFLKSRSSDVVAIPTKGTSAMQAFPLGAASNALVIAFKRGDDIKDLPSR